MHVKDEPLSDGQRLSLSLPISLAAFGMGIAVFVSSVGGPVEPDQENLLRLVLGAYAAMSVLAFGANLVLLARLAHRHDSWRFGYDPLVTRRFAGFHLLSMSALWLSTFALHSSWV